MELLLIRHGLPLRVESDRPVDPPLSPEGHDQAAALAEWLHESPPNYVLSSTMNRAIETAQHVGDAFGLDVHQDEDLCEFDRGSHAYIPIEELDKDSPILAQFIDDWFGPAGSEKRAVFRDRVVAALDRHVRSIDAERIAVVCHGGVINALLANVLANDRMLFFEPIYTSISRVTWTGKAYRLGSINEAGHLRSLKR